MPGKMNPVTAYEDPDPAIHSKKVSPSYAPVPSYQAVIKSPVSLV